MNQPTHSNGPRSDDVQMTVQDALERAVQWIKEGKTEGAEAILQQILRQKPDEPSTINLLALLRHRQGRSPEAIELLRRVTELAPGSASPWLNLGNILIESERPVQAVEPLRRAIELDPDSADAFNNLGLAYLHADRMEDSDAAFRKGLELAPKRADLHQNYARMLRLDGRRQESVEHSLQAIEIDPEFTVARQSLCTTYYELGELKLAADALHEWQQRDPDNPEVRHLLGAIGEVDAPPRAADDYVEEIFDEFAETFDRKLAILNYRAPQLVTNALAAVAPVLPSPSTALDAGCGTGLCGPLVKPLVGRLVGVDLSQGMLHKAHQLKLYDQLVHAELTAYLRNNEAAFDVVISADTLCYFGELEEVFAASQRSLRPDGYLIFSVEAAPAEDKDFTLQMNGRYKHSKQYLVRQLRRAGFAVAAMSSRTLRTELDVPVDGWIVTAVRLPDD